jgi:hypothetical protein
MEAASTPETSVNFYQTTRRNIPEDIHPHTRRRENLKSQLLVYSKYEYKEKMLLSCSVYTTGRNTEEEMVKWKCLKERRLIRSSPELSFY